MNLLGNDGETKDLLAVSTEEGRILFYDTTDVVETQATETCSKSGIPILREFCQLGGAVEGLTGRVKDFEILKPPGSEAFIIVTGSSDGAVRLWTIDESELLVEPSVSRDLHDETSIANGGDATKPGIAMKASSTRQIGSLLGAYEAGNRVTCVKAFVMLDPAIETNGSKEGIINNRSKRVDSAEEHSMSS